MEIPFNKIKSFINGKRRKYNRSSLRILYLTGKDLSVDEISFILKVPKNKISKVIYDFKRFGLKGLAIDSNKMKYYPEIINKIKLVNGEIRKKLTENLKPHMRRKFKLLLYIGSGLSLVEAANKTGLSRDNAYFLLRTFWKLKFEEYSKRDSHNKKSFLSDEQWLKVARWFWDKQSLTYEYNLKDCSMISERINKLWGRRFTPQYLYKKIGEVVRSC